MRLQEHIEFTTLHWVKPELDRTFAEAREALVGYVENPGKKPLMRACVSCMHQVHGTLRMIALHGAALAAQEMETLAIALLEEHVATREDAYAALMQGLMQLPDYLERLSAGHRDVSVVLLPMINQLRASRGQEPLDESALFNPDLDARLPEQAGAAPPGQAASREALPQLRVRFQQQLLGWFRGQDAGRQLAGMRHSMLAIAACCGTVVGRRLWWISAGVLEGLEQGVLGEHAAEIRQLMGKVDRHLRALIEQGEDALRGGDAEDLARRLLYLVARSAQASPRMRELSDTYQLASLMPDAAELEHARGSMAGHNRELLDSVSRAIKDDLLRVKEALDLFTRQPSGDPARLREQSVVLERVGDTLGMLALAVPRRVINEQRRVLEDIADRHRAPDEEILLEVASALLYVEASLDDHIDSLGADTPAADAAPTLPRSEARHIMATLMHEAVANTSHVRERIVAFVESAWRHEELRGSPAWMDEVAGALRMLSAARPGDLAEAIGRFIGDELLADRQVPDATQMDHLADALAALEYYLEAMREHRGGLEHILDVAEHSLGALGYWPLPAPREGTPTTVADADHTAPIEGLEAVAHAELTAPVNLAPGDGLDSLFLGGNAPVPPVEHDLHELRPVATEPTRPPVHGAADDGEWDEIEEEIEEALAGGDPLLAQAGFQLGADGIDDEIRSIFLDEMQEEIENLRQGERSWLAAPDDRDALSPLRRAFHTLKGSGRLVGARVLGEFAWRVEDVLNRVLDGSVAPGPDVQAVVHHAIEALPQLHDALAANVRPDMPLSAIMQAAERLAAGHPARVEEFAAGSPTVRRTVRRRVPRVSPGAIPSAAYTDANSRAVEPTATSAPESAGLPPVDPVLLEILRSEVAQHLQVVRAALKQADTQLPVDEHLLRAVHTLHGAIAMVDIAPLNQLLSPLEGLLKRARACGRPLDAEGIDALSRSADAVDTTMAQFDRAQPILPVLDTLVERITALRDALPEPQSTSMPMGYDVEAPASDVDTAEQDVSTPVDASAPAPASEPSYAAPLTPFEAELRAALDAFQPPSGAADAADASITQNEGLDAGREASGVADAATSDDAGMVATTDAFGSVPDARAEGARGAAAGPSAGAVDAAPWWLEAGDDAAYADGIAQDDAARDQAVPVFGTRPMEHRGDGAEAVVPAEADANLADAADAAARTDDAILAAGDARASGAVHAPEAAVEHGTLDAAGHDDAANDAQAPAESHPAEATLAEQPADAAGAIQGMGQAGDTAPESDFHDVAAPGQTVSPRRFMFDAYAWPGAKPADQPRDDGSLPSSDVVDRPAAVEEQTPVRTDDVTEAVPASGIDRDDHGDRAVGMHGEPVDMDAGVGADEHHAAGVGASLAPDHDEDMTTFADQPADAVPSATPAPGRPLRDDRPIDGPTRDETAPRDDAIAAAASAADAEAGRSDGDDADAEGTYWSGQVDPDLLEVFTEEAREILDHADGVLAQWRAEPDALAHVPNLQRDLHTLKGGARIAGLMPVGDLAHAIETLLEKPLGDDRARTGRVIALMEAGFDTLHRQVLRVARGAGIAYPQALIDRLLGMAGAQQLDAPEAATRPVVPSVAAAAPSASQTPAESDEPVLDLPDLLPEHDADARGPHEQLRVRAELLDNLVNHAGEVAIYRSRLEQQVAGYRFNLVELDQTVQRLRSQLRMLEIETEAQIIARYQREHRDTAGAFDPLELDRYSQLQQYSRALAESVSDLVSIQSMLDELTRQAETLLIQQSRVSSELQDGLLRTRMLPFDTMVPNLRRTLRQAVLDEGKAAQLHVEGAHGEMDRNLLDRLKAPFEHMLRNAVVHGIESPDERRRAGKPAEGAVRIRVAREATEVVVRVSDDGRGLNRAAIRARALGRGLLRPDAQPADDQLLAFITRPGFSTASEVTQLAGRGVGMDVVANQIKQLGGSLAIESADGQGSTFTLRLPFTLAVTQAILVRIGESSFAIPMTSVQGVSRIAPGDLAARLAAEEPHFDHAGERYGIYDLGNLLGLSAAHAGGDEPLPLLLTRAGDLRAAIRIDAVLGSREIVVKPVGPQISSVPGLLGATIMGDGSVLMILDLAPLVRHGLARRQDGDAARVEAPVPAAETRVRPRVMVVDDSITMRKVTGRVLERHEYEVSTAKDGVDALEKLAEHLPDLMLLDIEMPRMDGYELAAQMKHDPRLRAIPIIMITSRTGEKHRQRALDIGVERYLGKPYNEAELLALIERLLGARGSDDRHG